MAIAPPSAPTAGHPLENMAKTLAALPPQHNPLKNPMAMASLHPTMQMHVRSIAQHPGLAHLATNGTGVMGSSPSGGSGASFAHAQDSVAPTQSLFKRLPSVRHQIAGSAANVFGGAGTQQQVYTPQVRFKGNRLVIPSATAAGTTINNMLVGVKPQYAAASVEAFDFFEEQSTGGQWDLDVCEIGQKITHNTTVTGATTVYSAIIGEMLDGRAYPMLRSPIKRMAATSCNVLAGATFNFNLTPQVRFKLRKLIADDATAKYFVVNAFTVGITPQFVSGDPIPLATFTEIAQDVWLDCDEAYVGNVININVTNIDGATHVCNISSLGDVNPADLVGSNYGG